MEHEIKKNQPIVCPCCGYEESYVDEYEMDFEVSGTLFSVRRICCACAHSFTDYYLAKYDGYADTTGFYNKDGEREGD